MGDFLMKETRKTKDRRQFIKDGLRTVVLSGLAFAGLSLGRRSRYRSGYEGSCSLDLPCRICSQLPGCRKPEAIGTKRKVEKSRKRPALQERGAE
jgi:hypothetical protein